MARRAAGTNPAGRIEDHYRTVAEELIRRMREGTAPWTEAWQPGERRELPTNVHTGRTYRGGNSLWLASTARQRGWADPRWGTFRQVRELGGHVRRGEQGTKIVYWQFERRWRARDAAGRPRVDGQGKPVYETQPLASPRGYTHTVFNAEQCNGLPRREPVVAQARWSPIEEAERTLVDAGATLEHSAANRAYYDLARDRIVLPFRDQFPTAVHYYQTALHELGHWTGHPDRLNRPTLMKGMEYGELSQEYAREELRAEIASMMLGERLQLGHDPARHASYVESWVKALHDDPREIYRAAQDAQQMSDWVLDRSREREETRAPVGREAAPVRAPEPDRPVGSTPALPPLPRPPEPEAGGQYRPLQRTAPTR